MARKKAFEFGVDCYYFKVYSMHGNPITVKRNDKEKAIIDYQSYVDSKKKCQWLGRWDGKKFLDVNFNALITVFT